MSNSLVRCSTCKRHIYATETSCPFCARSGIVTPAAMVMAASLMIAGCGGQPNEVKNADEAAPNQPAQATTDQPAPPPAPTPVMPSPAAYGGPPPPELQPTPMPPK